jgi:nickel-dependent lactate racemase
MNPVAIEYGNGSFTVMLPDRCDILEMTPVPPLANPRRAIEQSLSHPLGGLPFDALVGAVRKPRGTVTAAVAVADNTRPVPYDAEREDGILLPLLLRLRRSGIENRNVTIIVATGTHAPTSLEWKRRSFGKAIAGSYRIVDHDCAAPDLRFLDVVDGAPVKINREFLAADLRMVTGLVEPHFMAGFSGGRKTVCPGLAGLETTLRFHGPDYMDSPGATNLSTGQNPCHAFALAVAKKAGVHFSVNAVLNGEMRLSSVYSGDLESAHAAAMETVKRAAAIPARREYDIVLTHGGRVAVNHYQAAKAAFAAIPVVRRGGTVILAAWSGESEPVGKKEYRELMASLRESVPGAFSARLKSDAWRFVPDQWQAQKWDQFFRKIGSFDRLIYCTTNIERGELGALPGRNGYEFAGGRSPSIREMVQNALDRTLREAADKGSAPTIAYLKDGPYGVPLLRPEGDPPA